MKAWAIIVNAITSLNGVTWFLSALLFSYFLTPLLLGGIKNMKTSLILFVLVAITRFSIEEFTFQKAINILGANFHYGPVIRSMDFFLGMLIIPLYYKIKSYLEKIRYKICIKIVFTLIQIVFPIYIYYIMAKYNKNFLRGYFVLIFCINAIFFIAFDYGYLSKLIESKLVKIIMSCQMEMFMLQLSVPNIMLKIMIRLKLKSSKDLEFIFYIKLFFIFISAFLYKLMLKNNFTIIMDRIVYIILKFIN